MLLTFEKIQAIQKTRPEELLLWAPDTPPSHIYHDTELCSVNGKPPGFMGQYINFQMY